jgi:hypothetical protein
MKENTDGKGKYLFLPTTSGKMKLCYIGRQCAHLQVMCEYCQKSAMTYKFLLVGILVCVLLINLTQTLPSRQTSMITDGNNSNNIL